MESLGEFLKAVKMVGGVGLGGGSQDKVTQALLGMMTNMGKVSEAVSGGGSGPAARPPTMTLSPTGMSPSMPLGAGSMPGMGMPPLGAGSMPGMGMPPPGMMSGPGMPPGGPKIGTNPMAMQYLKSLVPGLNAGGGMMPGI